MGKASPIFVKLEKTNKVFTFRVAQRENEIMEVKINVMLFWVMT
jgi:hypothetical protein